MLCSFVIEIVSELLVETVHFGAKALEYVFTFHHNSPSFHLKIIYFIVTVQLKISRSVGNIHPLGSAKKRSLKLLEELNLESGLFSLKNRIVRIYKNNSHSGKHEGAAALSCDLLRQRLKTQRLGDTRIAGDLAGLLKMCS